MRKTYNELTEKDRAEIVECFMNGNMVKSISTILNISDRAVSRALKDDGVNTKRRNRYSLNELYFNNIDTEKKAYILGLIFADGFVGSEKYNNISLSLIEDDVDILYMVKDELDYTGEVRKMKRSKGYDTAKATYTINFSSCNMASALRRLGMNDVKSKRNTSIPNIDPQLLRHFIRGYFDGDGSISSHKNTRTHRLSNGEVKQYIYYKYSFSLIIPERCSADFLNLLPAISSITQSNSCGLIYISTSSTANLKMIYKYLYENATIFIKRKHNKFLEFMEHSLSD